MYFNMLSLWKTVLILTICVFNIQANADLPFEIQKCSAADTNCIAKRITEIIHKYPKGNSDFGLPPLDKLSVTNLVLSQSNSDGPVQLEFKLNSADMYGLEKTTVLRTVGFEDDLDTSKFEVYGVMPNILIKGDYETNGKILLLPLNGRGNAEITLKNVKFGMKTKVASLTKNGKRYGVVKKIKVQMEPELMQVNLENLFNGNTELASTMNQLINENWKDIWNELGAGINKFVEKLLGNLLNEVIHEFSYDDFYKKD